jgi:hypothetical protein
MSEGCSTEIIVRNMLPAWHVFESPVVNFSKKISLSMDNLTVLLPPSMAISPNKLFQSYKH